MRKAKEAAERIEAEVPNAQLYLAKLDLAEFDSVREFGEHLRQRYGTGSLDLLVNNAGIMALPKRTLNSQGLELQIATNYFGPFYYRSPFPFDEGRGRVEDCYSVGPQSRIQRVWSSIIYSLKDDMFRTVGHTPNQNWLISSSRFELHRRLSAANSCIASIAAHPGYAFTDLGRSVSRGFRILMKLSRPLFQSAEAGSLPLLFAATSPNAERVVIMARMVG